MKKITTIFSLLVLIGMLTGCSKSFLEREPSGDITVEQINETQKTVPSITETILTGIYSTTIATKTGGTTSRNDTDFGQKSIDIVMGVTCGDVALTSNKYGWFNTESQMQAYLRTSTKTYNLWRYYYRIIRVANEVIETSEKGTVGMPTDADDKAAWGQAIGVRGYCYYYIANLYSNFSNLDSPLAPIYTAKTDKSAARSTARQILEQAKNDFTASAEALKGFSRTAKSSFNEAIAKTYLAYTLMNLGDDVNAATVANEAIILAEAEGLRLLKLDEVTTTGFNKEDNPEWLWAFDVTEENAGGLASFFGHMDLYTYSYAMAGDIKGMDDNLYKSIPSTDKRKEQFQSSPKHAPIWKFYDSKRVVGGDRVWTNDVFFLRLSDLYLIKAEASARAGQDNVAQAALKALLDNRDINNASLVAKTGSALLKEIYHQIRIESWCEGKSYLAMKRFKTNVTRGDSHVNHAGATYGWDSKEMTFQIPDDEELNNPNL